MSTTRQTFFELTADGVSLWIKLSPSSRINQIDGIAQGPDGPLLKVRVTSAPEKGKANKALIKLLSKLTGVASGRFEVVSGMTSRQKRLIISGDQDEPLPPIVEWCENLKPKA